jgi:glycosyltransferase involved in cell wall biosynthesis
MGSSTVSVAIICQDEEETLPYALHCVDRVLRPCLKEVVIVDGGSTDDTLGVVSYYDDKLPIILLHSPYDSPGQQKNRALSHCTGALVLGIDADNSFTSNFCSLIQAGAFDSKTVWDFRWYELLPDEYHYDGYEYGMTTRLWRNGNKFHRDWHEEIDGQGDKSVCSTAWIFEHCLLQSRGAMEKRGQRWQRFVPQLEAGGQGPGGPSRYIDAHDKNLSHIAPLPQGILPLVVPRDSELLKEIDRKRK